MIIHSKFKDYEVHLENSFECLKSLLTADNTELVVDQKVYHLYPSLFEASQKNV